MQRKLPCRRKQQTLHVQKLRCSTAPEIPPLDISKRCRFGANKEVVQREREREREKERERDRLTQANESMSIQRPLPSFFRELWAKRRGRVNKGAYQPRNRATSCDQVSES